MNIPEPEGEPSRFQFCHRYFVQFVESEMRRPREQQILSYYQINALVTKGREVASFKQHGLPCSAQFEPRNEDEVLGISVLLPYLYNVYNAIVLAPTPDSNVNIAFAFGIRYHLIEHSYVWSKKIINWIQSLRIFLELGALTTFFDIHTGGALLVVVNTDYFYCPWIIVVRAMTCLSIWKNMKW